MQIIGTVMDSFLLDSHGRSRILIYASSKRMEKNNLSKKVVAFAKKSGLFTSILPFMARENRMEIV